MIVISLPTLAEITAGQLIVAANNTSLSIDDLVIDDLVTDSRAIDKNSAKICAFLALKGPNFDGHRFAQQVIEQGCQLLIVDHHLSEVIDTAQLVVSDTRIALGEIAAYVKKELAPKTVAITGSSGKTTVKEMVAAILSRLGKVLATQGNFNNDIGVPLTLLRLDSSHDFAVIEMGANHLGEIAYTTALTQPDVAVINNIAAAHLEGFGDLCGVARAKGEIFSGLGEHGVALYNQDSQYSDKWQWRLEGKAVRTFSCINSSPEGKAHCYSENVNLDENGYATFTLKTTQGSCEIHLTVPGKHNVCNAVAAACIALEFGASLDDICLGLAKMQPVKGRLNLYQLHDKKTACHIKLIDDSYNANLESAKAAAQLLSSYPGKKILILGDMAELGTDARSYHQELGEFAKSLQLNTLLSLGVLSQSASDAFAKDNDQSEQSQHFSQRAELMAHLLTMLNQQLSAGQQDIAILVKGSRSAHMEHVVTEITHWFEQMNSQESPNQAMNVSKENNASENMNASKNQCKEGKA
ncbi:MULTISPECIES: UDP-N-acetylmuramoyl-tripeptide--D-alanyl-D-alanine ligase [Colwellia]|uniref:UDP-N-acetylmuramoyl-tripeptide--D-alanyl-D-alanine ligase n=1 Tax=Colwellia marinimaniae TaxID=1513592 RepID=A0ABQ0MQ63_9GAMM|nr:MULTISPECIES: UDP-N-acetylmuramoyl-tripeptide--D-alanyl-D-alanine ligase [Colwellia]GAW94506.1 UDP-N-acetylmuramoyl-tripeptide--D-alanyl-D-alanine ligase [Colwellia marinimaniae]